jgi:RNA polymerase sigma-54 factor
MALSPSIGVRQAQALVVTPQMVQAIRLLQMPAGEVDRFVAAEIERNPLLRSADDAESGPPAPPQDARAVACTSAPQRVRATSSRLAGAQNPPARRERTEAASEPFEADPGIAAPASLAETLERTVHSAFSGLAVERRIAFALLGSLDESGYLAARLADIAAAEQATTAIVEAVLARCQVLAPPGLFARSLSECLALQLAALGRLDPAMQTLLANLPLVAAGERRALAEICGVDDADVDDMISEIRALDPKPGLAFREEIAVTAAPDVIVRALPEGGFAVELNEETLPRLIVDRDYHIRLAAGAIADADRRFLADCLQKATWLERCLDRRARTVLAVAGEIVRRQAGFLTAGIEKLRPLNLKTVAEAVGLHESTVSRAAANKTMATPRGVFEFRYFFPGALSATGGGEEHASEAVRQRIRQLILAEPPERVLSDEAIAATLSRQGVDIARRTVTKYRELMRIGSSVERRREKRGAAR